MDPRIETIAERLAWMMDSIKSVEIRTLTTITNLQSSQEAPTAFDSMSEHYIETVKGQRFLESQCLKGDSLVTRSTHFSDGLKCADVDYRLDNLSIQNAVFINRQFWMEDRMDKRQVPQPMAFMYVGLEPLHKALPSAVYLGEEPVDGQMCSKVLFKAVHWSTPQDHVYYLDSTLAIPREVRGYRDEAGRSKNDPLWVWKAQEFREERGHISAIRSSQIAYNNGVEIVKWEFNVKSIEYDKEYTTEVFWPTMQSGVSVIDSLSNRLIKTPGDPVVSQSGLTRTSGTAFGENHNIWPPSVSLALPVLSSFLILAGVFAWWRRA